MRVRAPPGEGSEGLSARPGPRAGTTRAAHKHVTGGGHADRPHRLGGFSAHAPQALQICVLQAQILHRVNDIHELAGHFLSRIIGIRAIETDEEPGGKGGGILPESDVPDIRTAVPEERHPLPFRALNGKAIISRGGNRRNRRVHSRPGSFCKRFQTGVQGQQAGGSDTPVPGPGGSPFRTLHVPLSGLYEILSANPAPCLVRLAENRGERLFRREPDLVGGASKRNRAGDPCHSETEEERERRRTWVFIS